MRPKPLIGALFIGLAACSTGPRNLMQSEAVRDEAGRPLEVIATANPRTRTGFGPPPYRYWRILGDEVTAEMQALEWNNDTPAPMQWNFIGPRPVTQEYWSGSANAGGRVVGIACHPTNAAIAYAASASGGVWKTSDTGNTWAPMTDGAAGLNHGAIALDRSFPEVVYAGTGEYTQGSTGVGILRSLDGGLNWSVLASATTLSGQCSGIAVVSGAAAASPAAIHWTGTSGYKRSTNGGVNWTTSIPLDCSSLVVDPVNAQRVFVGVRSSGIRRSLDGGATFATLAGGLPTIGFDRIVLAQCRGTPAVLYAAYASGSDIVGFYRTADGGDTWTLLAATPNFASPQAWYDISVGVDPSNPNRVFCGGVSPLYATAGVIESTNGGQTWTEISGSGGQIHPDQHAIAWGADGTPWFGCDGGVWRRTGSTWVNCNATLAAIQNYTISEHPNDANRLMTGTQDNGMAGTSTGGLAWPQLTAGDGGYGVYLPEVYTTLFTTYVYLRVYRKTLTSTTDISGPWSADTREWIAPLVTDANGGSVLYGGTNRLWQNTAATTSATWTTISDTTLADAGTLTAIATVAGAPGVIWVGNSRGGVWRTANSGVTWTRARLNDGTRISAISTKPGAPLVAVIARNTSSGQRVLRTTDGATWTSLTGTLPTGVTSKALAVDWDRGVPTIFVGSGAGVYASFDSGASWIKSGPDLPNVNIGQLEINRARRTIAAGTYGRGAWRSVLAKPADLDISGSIDGSDLALLLGAWGACSVPFNCPADINADGVVDGADLGAVLNSWGG
jgi:hypothetical protein